MAGKLAKQRRHAAKPRSREEDVLNIPYGLCPVLIMTKHLENLLEAARRAVPTTLEKEEQRRSFAYGNTNIENPRIG
jgi:hypothetical protein